MTKLLTQSEAAEFYRRRDRSCGLPTVANCHGLSSPTAKSDSTRPTWHVGSNRTNGQWPKVASREETQSPPPTIGYGSVRADEVLPLREAARRLGWEQKTIRRCSAKGLAVVQFGRFKYVTGKHVLAFIDGLFTRQRLDEGGNADGQ